MNKALLGASRGLPCLPQCCVQRGGCRRSLHGTGSHCMGSPTRPLHILQRLESFRRGRFLCSHPESLAFSRVYPNGKNRLIQQAGWNLPFVKGRTVHSTRLKTEKELVRSKRCRQGEDAAPIGGSHCPSSTRQSHTKQRIHTRGCPVPS